MHPMVQYAIIGFQRRYTVRYVFVGAREWRSAPRTIVATRRWEKSHNERGGGGVVNYLNILRIINSLSDMTV